MLDPILWRLSAKICWGQVLYLYLILKHLFPSTWSYPKSRILVLGINILELSNSNKHFFKYTQSTFQNETNCKLFR